MQQSLHYYSHQKILGGSFLFIWSKLNAVDDKIDFTKTINKILRVWLKFVIMFAAIIGNFSLQLSGTLLCNSRCAFSIQQIDRPKNERDTLLNYFWRDSY